MFIDPVFSDLDLDGKGNVIFTFRAGLDPSAVSYSKRLESLVPPAQPAGQTQTVGTTTPAGTASSTPVKTVTASTTQKTATTTR
jgi:hypothetical protein